MKGSKELHVKSPEELRTRIQELKKELFKSTGSVSTANPGKRRQLRKYIARALTIIAQKETRQKGGE